MTAGAQPFVSGVVLAAGAAARMGSAKQLLPLGGRSLLQGVVDEACRSRLHEVVVVLGTRAREIAAALVMPDGCGVRVVVNEQFAAGIASSLKCGLGACDESADAAAVLLGDQPGVGAALIDRVLDAYARERAPLTRPMFVTSAGARVPGHPAVLAREVWREAEALEGDEGARSLFVRDAGRVCEVSIDGEPPLDVDTPDDYRRALAESAMTRGS